MFQKKIFKANSSFSKKELINYSEKSLFNRSQAKDQFIKNEAYWLVTPHVEDYEFYFHE